MWLGGAGGGSSDGQDRMLLCDMPGDRILCPGLVDTAHWAGAIAFYPHRFHAAPLGLTLAPSGLHPPSPRSFPSGTVYPSPPNFSGFDEDKEPIGPI